jgi:hypothetical protein
MELLEKALRDDQDAQPLNGKRGLGTRISADYNKSTSP